MLERTRAHYELPLEMARVIPNPTPSVPPQERWRPDDCQPGTILFVGRFDRVKGGDLIVDAFARVLSSVPNARLWFAGPDKGLEDIHGRQWDLPRYVDDRIPGARDSGRVRLLGHVPHSELAGLRRRAAVVVACSRYETFGGTVVEAAAAGCPVVAARVGGIPEILRDGVDGQLHHPGDAQDLATAILSLLNDSARAAELGRQAAIRCEDLFSPIAVAARMAAHYRSLVTTRCLPRERVMMPGGMAPQGLMNSRPGLGALPR
ncbi:MAG: glycosyltransferase family 4 protein [Isosphaeraceae bacterium]